MSAPNAALAVQVGPEDHSLGPPQAPITLVEYGDYECPYCGEAFVIVRELQRTFGDSLRFVFRNFPLAAIHPHAQQAAEVAEAVALQGDFWPVYDVLYENQRDLSTAALRRYAAQAGADVEQAFEAIRDGTPGRRVERDLQSGTRSGVQGTPAFFVNGERYDAPWDYETLAAYLHRLVA
jgi:protein-disulfide isomerase